MMSDGLVDGYFATVSWYPTHSRQQSMAVARVNREIVALHLNWRTSSLPEGTTITVCSATVDEWNAFVESENHEIRSTHMEWCDDTILIVEFPTMEHETFGEEFRLNFMQNNIIRRHMKGYGAGFVRKDNPRLEPDLSYGPKAGPLPAGLHRHWDWHTLKVEIGFSRRWGNAHGQLDWKANQWATFVGVRYVLCVAIWPDLSRAEYKLYTVQGLNIQLPQQNPIPVATPHTLVLFDSRVLLGLQPADRLPIGFPNPLTVDLYQTLEDAREALP